MRTKQYVVEVFAGGGEAFLADVITKQIEIEKRTSKAKLITMSCRSGGCAILVFEKEERDNS